MRGEGSLALIAYLAVQMGPKERYTHHCKEHNKGPKTHDHISRRIVILDENQTVEKKTNQWYVGDINHESYKFE